MGTSTPLVITLFAFLASIAITALVGLLDEGVKIIIPGREFELIDFGLDVLAGIGGSTVGTVGCLAVTGIRRLLG